jgi:hypothetical protein
MKIPAKLLPVQKLRLAAPFSSMMGGTQYPLVKPQSSRCPARVRGRVRRSFFTSLLTALRLRPSSFGQRRNAQPLFAHGLNQTHALRGQAGDHVQRVCEGDDFVSLLLFQVMHCLPRLRYVANG